MMGVRKMLSLIFSRETTIQSSVVTAYKRLYIDLPEDGGGGGLNGEGAAAVSILWLIDRPSPTSSDCHTLNAIEIY